MAALLLTLPRSLRLLAPDIADLVQRKGNNEDEDPELYPHSHVRSLKMTKKNRPEGRFFHKDGLAVLRQPINGWRCTS